MCVCHVRWPIKGADRNVVTIKNKKKKQYGNKNSYHNSKNVISDYLPLHAIFAKKKKQKIRMACKEMCECMHFFACLVCSLKNSYEFVSIKYFAQPSHVIIKFFTITIVKIFIEVMRKCY